MKNINEKFFSPKRIDINSDLNRLTNSDLDDQYYWILENNNTCCPACLEHSKRGILSLREWLKFALPGIPNGTNLGVTSTNYPDSTWDYGTFCESNCRCYLSKVSGSQFTSILLKDIEKSKLETRELKINKNGGVSAISLVDEPAIEMDFVYFEKEKEYLFKTIENEKRIVSGPALIPDIKILRKDEDGYYNVFMTAETIEQVAEKYLFSNNQHNVTLGHESSVNDVCLIESWIVSDPKNDKSNTLGYDVPKGTWMVSLKVLNDDIWENFVKSGVVKGFSIEGMFEQFNKIEDEYDKILEQLKEFLKNAK